MLRAFLVTALIILLLPLNALAKSGRGDFVYWEPPEDLVRILVSTTGKRWEDMSPAEQEEVRRRKAEYDALPASEQRRLRRARDQYESMTPENRREIRERWEKLSPEEKQRHRVQRANELDRSR